MATDTAKFVITGEFHSGEMLKQIEASLGALKSKVGAAGKAAGKELSSKMSEETRKGTKAAASKAAPDPKPYRETQGELVKINADLFTAVRRVVLWGAASRVVFEGMQKIRGAVTDIITLNKTLTDIVR